MQSEDTVMAESGEGFAPEKPDFPHGTPEQRQKELLPAGQSIDEIMSAAEQEFKALDQESHHSVTPTKAFGIGSVSFVTHDPTYNTYQEEEEEVEEDDDDGIVNSPCPPGIWLNMDGFTPKGKNRSPFRLVGSPTMHRVMDGVYKLFYQVTCSTDRKGA